MPAIIEVSNLTKNYGNVKAVKGIDFYVNILVLVATGILFYTLAVIRISIKKRD